MLSLRKPSDQQIRRFLDSQAERPFSYSAVGGTSSEPPSGYVVDHTRVGLGHGQAVFEAARRKLQGWEQFRLGWVDVCWPTASIAEGEVVGVLARIMGSLWSLNACRIIYVVDEPQPSPRFGFAYGTLPDHAGAGEERFLIEWDAESDAVLYDIFAFSRPNQLLSRAGYAYMRRKQTQFARDSVAAMRRGLPAAGESQTA